jgi:ABC-type lipoprotein release transport system permease subunit
MRTFKLAWRNLGRNRRRTVITGAALVVGVALSVAAFGLTDGMNAELLRALTKNELGHVQIHDPKYPESRGLRDTLDHPDELLVAVAKTPDVVSYAPRVYSFGLFSANGKSLGAELIGVDPALERGVTTLQDQAVAGHYLPDEPAPWPRGRKLTAKEAARDAELTADAEADVLAEIDALDGESDGTDGAPPTIDRATSREESQELAEALSPPPERPPLVYVGSAFADILGVEVGDQIHASTQAVDGTTEEAFFQVVGIFKTGTAMFDRARVYMNLVDMQRFTHLYDRIHEIAVIGKTPNRAGKLAANLRKNLPDGELVRTWSEIRPDIKTMLDLNNVSMAVTIAIIFFVAALGVVNTMLMAVYERTRELGMLKAIGMSGRRIMGLIVVETLLLVLVFSVVGTGFGFLMDLYLVHHGVDFSAYTSGFSMGGIGLNPLFHGAITVHGLVLPTIILSGVCFLASFYPALRAARLKPAVGMRET